MTYAELYVLQTTEALRLEMTEMEKELVSCESQLKTSAEAVSAIETRSSELTNDAKKHNVKNLLSLPCFAFTGCKRNISVMQINLYFN